MNEVEKVKRLCKERRIPITRLEKACGFCNGYIGRLKKGVFPSDRLIKIANYLGMPLAELTETATTAGLDYMQKPAKSYTINQYTTRLNEQRLPYIYKEAEHDNLVTLECNTPEKAVNLLNDIFHCDDLPYEEVYVIGLNAQNTACGVYKVAQGTVDMAAVSPREIMMNLLLSGVAGSIVAHNHPSSDTAPSEEDITFSRTLKDAGKLMSIPLRDSIIIGKNCYFSMLERGVL